MFKFNFCSGSHLWLTVKWTTFVFNPLKFRSHFLDLQEISNARITPSPAISPFLFKAVAHKRRDKRERHSPPIAGIQCLVFYSTSDDGQVELSPPRSVPPLIRQHRHTLLNRPIRVRRPNCVFRNKTLFHKADKYPCCHIPRAYICQHLCATMAVAPSPHPAHNSQQGP